MLKTDRLGQAIQDYLVNYSIEANLAPTTVKNKHDILKRLLPFLGEKPFNLQTCREFLSYMYSNGWEKPNSRLDLVRVLRAFVNFLYKYKYIPENFAQELVKPKVPKENVDYPSPEIAEKIIILGTEPGSEDNSRNRAIKAEMRIALRFILRTGLRISELINLKGSDLNLYTDPPTYFVRSKGGNRERLPFPIDMVEELKVRQNNDRVFAVTDKTCNAVLQRGAKALGLPIKLTNHSLRHIFASNLVKNGVPMQMVARLMRHKSAEITDKTYTHLNVSDLSMILNSKQSIITEGLTPHQMLDNVEHSIRNSGIKNDSRFVVSIERDEIARQMFIRIKF